MYKHLNQEQRYEIAAYLKTGKSLRKIAAELKVNPGTISREIKRNSDKRSYHGKRAHEHSCDRKNDWLHKKKFTPAMEKCIRDKLGKKWSPEQITGRCKAEGTPMMSHESIYQYIWKDKSLGGNLWKHLRHGHKKYRKRYGSKDNRGQIQNRINISQRPDIVNQKQRIGDWEIDTIIGKNHQGAILTAAERKTNFTLMLKLESKHANTARKGIINLFAPYKEQVFTITSDNGHEFAGHQAIAEKLNAGYFFANPYHSWERGLNEYQNKLIRQYIPKKTDFKPIKPEEILFIQNELNQRPRKKLNFKTPNELFFNYSVALIA